MTRTLDFSHRLITRPKEYSSQSKTVNLLPISRTLFFQTSRYALEANFNVDYDWLTE